MKGVQSSIKIFEVPIIANEIKKRNFESIYQEIGLIEINNATMKK